ncbi:uncharacterized protein PQBP1 [Drosophila virilis]|uniref:WW domain-containing protein n=1 Tax=Drosophila virilis TaxID=7244 RepID=B4MC88_DROVI|nr:uncharacterized protein LOC6635262 [Drosophila virilis]EDW63170.1 uncharacterized protein Dvir_GJ11169 [Drosophila virilis]
MSLPPMLLQRLASRGLLITKNDQKPIAEAIEEIIAENYDEDDKNDNNGHHTTNSKYTVINENLWPDRIKERIGVTESHHGFKFCPNIYNIWHTCTLYCVNRWANGRPKPKENYLRRYKRLIRKYPISADWKDVYDNGCGSYYFYNSATRKVSWLPPTHPNARVSSSAAIFRKQLAYSNDEYNFDTKDFTSHKYNEIEINTPVSSLYPSKKPKTRDLELKALRKHRI